LVLLRDGGDEGTLGYSTAEIKLTDDEVDDLSRYLDVTRAEILFARGVILVEGDAERFLVPTFAAKLKKPLDKLGITVCSVAGTNFIPYVKLLGGLGIPYSVITDWDPRGGDKDPLGYNRSLRLISTIEKMRTGKIPTALIAELKALDDWSEYERRCDGFGVFTNAHTLEVDLFGTNGDYREAVIETLREGPFGPERKGWIDEWEAHPDELDIDKFLALVDQIGKGRFAQRLGARIADLNPPSYIAKAIKYVADRV
jgi:putative ATP-dependent endonuclease of OLD family